MRLRRSVPFVATRADGAPGPVMLVDRAEAPESAATNDALLTRLRDRLRLGAAEHVVGVAEAEALILDQYGACLEYLYSHPAWSSVRRGEGGHFLLGYLLENRHYLAAAPTRMANGIGPGRPDLLNELQARHVVEEAGHETFFENGLAALGCGLAQVRAARPFPVTIEWIHLMRTVAEAAPLSAAICSGLLEFTAGNREAVAGWHEHLVASGQLPAAVVGAVFEHVRVDLGLGHGQNWRHALAAAGGVRADVLADALNDTTLIAEMLVRWTDSLVEGLSGDLVGQLTPDARPGVDHGLGDGAGYVVWPAGVLHLLTHGDATATAGTRESVAAAYGLAPGREASAGPSSVHAAAADLCAHFADPLGERPTGDELEKLVGSWMRTVDGHALWTGLTEAPTYPLVLGWLLENYHYVAAIWQHCGAGLSTCTDPQLRTALVHHLAEEFDHGAMFRRGIATDARFGELRPESLRPLATTRAFTGYLRGLAQRDWRGYVLAIAFLQLTLTAAPGEGSSTGRVHPRHHDFYEVLRSTLPEAGHLVATMRRHDAEDTELDHGADVRAMLDRLAAIGVPRSSIDAAALVPQLTWGFLDGIHQHYGKGAIAVAGRMGWSTDPPDPAEPTGVDAA